MRAHSATGERVFEPLTQNVLEKSCYWLSQNHLISVIPRDMYIQSTTNNCCQEAT